MITPRFQLAQKDGLLIITIRAPYCSLRELDVSVEENIFIFYCKPYYLRLELPGNILDNEQSHSSFDTDNGTFEFSYEKENPTEEFRDLEFITKFLTSKVDVDCAEGQRKIDPIETEQVLTVESATDSTEHDLNKGFGFALRGNRNFTYISSTFEDVIEVDPVCVPLPERKKLRLQDEKQKFNVEHYFAEFLEDDEIKEIMHYEPSQDTSKTTVDFSERDLDFLKDLPNIEYSLQDLQVKYIHNGLIDILFAYCYDKRTTFFEESPESGWTIVKLAATLCWMDAFEEPKETLICAFRRCLIYPLYRNFSLNMTVLQDLRELLKLGEKHIIKCLIEIHDMFLKGDCCRYILNNLFIKDYITFIMKWNKEEWAEIVEKVNNIVISKDELGLNLTEIELGCSDLNTQLAKLRVNSETDSDDTSADSESEYSTETDSEDENIPEKIMQLQYQ